MAIIFWIDVTLVGLLVIVVLAALTSQKGKRGPNKQQRKLTTLLIISLAIFIILRATTYIEEPDTVPITKSEEEINSFEDCTEAGYPAMESYPRQCRTAGGKHFVENITISEPE